MQSGQLRPLCDLEKHDKLKVCISAPRELFRNARLRVSQETGKKAPVIGFLVPFYVKHSKFVSALCDQSK